MARLGKWESVVIVLFAAVRGSTTLAISGLHHVSEPILAIESTTTVSVLPELSLNNLFLIIKTGPDRLLQEPSK